MTTPSRTTLNVLSLFKFPCLTRQPATIARFEPVSVKTSRTTASPMTTSSCIGGSLFESSPWKGKVSDRDQRHDSPVYVCSMGNVATAIF